MVSNGAYMLEQVVLNEYHTRVKNPTAVPSGAALRLRVPDSLSGGAPVVCGRTSSHAGFRKRALRRVPGSTLGAAPVCFPPRREPATRHAMSAIRPFPELDKPLSGDAGRSCTVPARHYTDREIEDQSLCESVQQGLKPQSYNQGRFMVDPALSGTAEHGVHQFHRLVTRALA